MLILRNCATSLCLPCTTPMMGSQLKSHPSHHAFDQLTYQSGCPWPVVRGAASLPLDPAGKALYNRRLVERNHQLVVKKQASFIQIGRANQSQVIVDEHSFGVDHAGRQPDSCPRSSELPQG